MYFTWPSEEYDKQVDIICKELEKAKTVFCIAHPNSDGDALGSQLALYHYCKATGKECVCLNFDPLPEQLSWLEGSEDVLPDLPHDGQYDIAFLMETTDVKRMGDRVRFFDRAKVSVHLDHHIGVKGLGTINLIDEKASSTCEILYNVLEKMGTPLPKECREAIYVGIMTDTGNFRYNNSTPRAHKIIAKIVENDLIIDEIYKRVYENTGFHRVVIHGTAMARAQQHCQGKLVASWLSLEDFSKSGASEVDSDGCIRNLSCIKGIEAAILFKEMEDGKVKISFRSTGKIDVRQISQSFGGGGHKLAAGAQHDGPLNTAIDQVVNAVCNKIEQFEAQNA